MQNRNSNLEKFLVVATCFVVAVSSVAVAGYWLGSQRSLAHLASDKDATAIPMEVLRATATHGGPNLAVATGRVSDEADGIFFLDYLTGNLQCWVYYPRIQKFGAKFETNITQQLPATKNAEYLLVTGQTEAAASASNARPGGCLVYVIDVKSGLFAAYTMPWMRAAEFSGQMQIAPLIAVDGGMYRMPLAGGGMKKPVPGAKENPKENQKENPKDKAAVGKEAK